MNFKIRELMDWWKGFNKETIKVSTENYQFQIELKTNVLPHLLGLQYTQNKNTQLRGLDLFFFVTVKVMKKYLI